MNTEQKKCRILSIDAWRDGDGWTWNQWYKVGEITEEEFSEFYKVNGWQCNKRALFKYMRDAGYLSKASAGRVSMEDDQYNVVIYDKNTLEPLFAIEYGAVES
jgi:hypothetical protein